MITKVIPEEQIIAVLKLIHKASKVAIVSHKRPDGDAIGSSLALYHFLYTQGKEATVILPDGIPGFFKSLPSADNIINYETRPDIAKKVLDECDLLFCLDFNFPNRVGDLENLIVECKAKKVLVDHHRNHGDFCDVTISHPEIASTSELIFRLICRMGYFQDMSLECAQCICNGMLTDTGGLAFNSNEPDMYSIFYELLKKGVDKDAIYRQAFNNYSENRMRLMGYVLYNKMKVYNEYHTAVITLNYKEMQQFGYQPGDSEGFVNMPLSIDHVFVSIFLKEEKDIIKLSFRSQGTFDVNVMAKELFGGGGHINASGAEYKGTMEETLKIVEEAIPKFYQKFRN
ncbi:MAG: bifunctional oligoribonuclease/PAP phosphatase NrnA [Paludibacteraceae bacterium]|nr:bifunctional oligoribonuclease/PAP phosphatase NrnA [Paludibacteraceae bacterium]